MKKNWNWGLTKNYIKKYKNLSLLILFHRIMKKMVFNVKIVNDPPRLNFIFILQCFLFVFILCFLICFYSLLCTKGILDIKKIEAKKKEIQNRFTQEEHTPKEIEELSIELGLLEKELETKTLKWFELSEISE